MSNKIIEVRVIAGEIELEWDDLRSQDERDGIWVLEVKETPKGVEFEESFESMQITHHEYKGHAFVYYNENREVTRVGHLIDPNDKHAGYVTLIKQAGLKKFVIKKLNIHKVTGARVTWEQEYIAEWGKLATKGLGKVWFGSMNNVGKKWYRLYGIKHDLVGDRLANAISDFSILKND